jgi:hypothetical protein
MSALTTHTYSNPREKRKEKINKKKRQQMNESQRKAKRKITGRRQVSEPLGKGNGSTHPRQNYAQAKSANHQSKARKPQRAPPAHMQAPPARQNYAQAKSANHQSKARKPQRAPPAHMQAPPEPMQPPWTNACKPPCKQSSCFSFALTGQTGQHPTGQIGAQHMNRTSTLTGQTGAQQSPEMARTT